MARFHCFFFEFLPNLPQTATRNRVIPLATGVAGAIALISGIYLFQQGQKLITRVNPTPEKALTKDSVSSSGSFSNIAPAQTAEARSGDRGLRDPAARLNPDNSTQWVDSVSHKAMAPVRDSVEKEAAPSSKEESSPSHANSTFEE